MLIVDLNSITDHKGDAPFNMIKLNQQTGFGFNFFQFGLLLSDIAKYQK